MRKILILSLSTICYLLATVKPALADSKFATTYDLIYKVSENGITTVTQNFIIVNKTSEFFPQEYVTKIGKREIANVKAFDKTGPLAVALIGEGDNRTISIKFNHQSAGIGKVLNWTLAFESAEIARLHNQIWEIFIPRPNDQDGVDDYTLSLYVPSSFGTPYILKPKPQNSDHIWSKNELTASGIFASFYLGKTDNPRQIYDFKLRYHLRNSKLYPVESEVAIPSDNNYQKIYLQTLLPQPVNVTIDADGDWLAKYFLGPAANLDILATGSAVIFYRPQSLTSESLLGNYLRPKRYWESNSPLVVALAQKLTTPEAIYNYVVKTLKYDYERAKNNLSRLGATGILLTPEKAICLEFTDLFIAIARAAGIPAREVNGFALALDTLLQPTTLTKDSLHSWPEYFDPGVTPGWRMVDPTWGNTTGGIDYFQSLDTNHFAFVIKGQNSTAPAPAGTYKLNGDSSKDVEVAYHQGEFDFDQSPKISLRTNINPTMTSGFSFPGKIYLDNAGPTIYPGDRVSLSSQNLTIINQNSQTLAIAPFGHLELPFTVLSINWNQTENDIITVEFAGFSKRYPVTFSPIYQNKTILTIGGLTFLGILSIIAQITWGILFQKRRGRNNLHRQS